MRSQRHTPDVHLDALDWRTDPAYLELAIKRDSMAQRRGALPAAIAEAECQAKDAAERHEEQELLALVKRSDPKAHQQTKARVDSTADTLRRLRAEQLLITEELPRIERAAALIAKEARRRCQGQLQRLYAEAAAEFAEVLPQVVALQARLAAIHRKAGQLFPPTIGRPRPEVDDHLPAYASLPNLSLAELVHHPHADGGGQLGRVEARLAGFLADHGGGVAIAE
jgi:hypothetical protein